MEVHTHNTHPRLDAKSLFQEEEKDPQLDTKQAKGLASYSIHLPCSTAVGPLTPYLLPPYLYLYPISCPPTFYLDPPPRSSPGVASARQPPGCPQRPGTADKLAAVRCKDARSGPCQPRKRVSLFLLFRAKEGKTPVCRSATFFFLQFCESVVSIEVISAHAIVCLQRICIFPPS